MNLSAGEEKITDVEMGLADSPVDKEGEGRAGTH